MTNFNYTVEPGKKHKKSPSGNQFPADSTIYFNQQTLFQRFDIQFYRANHVLRIQDSVKVFLSKDTFFKH